MYLFFFKQKTAYEMRISDWSSDVCSSDLAHRGQRIVLDRLGDAEEKQADAHAGTEQHRKPRKVAIVGLAVIRPQLHVAISAEHQKQDKEQKAGNGDDIKPAELDCDYRLGG